ncbi:MAG: hypothetical protein COA82_04045 [Alkaliphilus sp.]|nr:MAG: hypothetical protein COA82_04045 [Alkaliphilus sp.]
MERINERLEKLLIKIREKSFRENRGLGNEVGFHVFDYDPEDELVVRDGIKQIKSKATSQELQIQEFDLFEVMLEILGGKGFLQKTFQMEKKKGTEKIIDPIRRTLRFNQSDDKIINYIKERINYNSIVFLTGIGKAWPIIRSHSILNALHLAIEDVPVIMFFPGTYDGQRLVLFNEFQDDNYYRAFKIVGR